MNDQGQRERDEDSAMIAENTLKTMPDADWGAFAVDHVAYVKRIEMNGQVGYAIHAADGTPITVMDNRDVAMAAVRQNGLEPASVH
jgi:hypothetical protein